MEYKYSGIIVGKNDVGETDRIYSIYTLEQGKISALAKGVRKPKAKLAGFLENFTLADISIMRKSGIGKITGSIVENNFSSLKRDYDALSQVISTVKIFNRMTEQDLEQGSLFWLLKGYLESIDSQCLLGRINSVSYVDKLDILSAAFLVKMLDELGYAWQMKECSFCHNKISQEFIFFSPKEGGLVCRECLETDSVVRQISADAVKAVRIILSNDIKSLVKLNLSKKEIDLIKVMAKECMAWM